jgi:type III pantothenate kinase
MLLAIDIGNTHTVIGYFLDDELTQQWRVSTHPLCTADEFKHKLDGILNSGGIQLSSIDTIVASSVVPRFVKMLETVFKLKKLYVIDYRSPFSFQLKVDSPQEVGTDRLVNAEAAIRDYGFPCIVVDSGTATTICAISKNSNGQAAYLGGAIIPGMELSMQALAEKAAKLFTIELTPPKNPIGSSTQEAFKSGLLLGYASMIDGMVNRFKKELGVSQLPVIATGGISYLLKDLTQELTHFDADLTLKGIAYIYDSIRGKL